MNEIDYMCKILMTLPVSEHSSEHHSSHERGGFARRPDKRRMLHVPSFRGGELHWHLSRSGRCRPPQDTSKMKLLTRRAGGYHIILEKTYRLLNDLRVIVVHTKGLLLSSRGRSWYGED